eukprot:1011677_1
MSTAFIVFYSCVFYLSTCQFTELSTESTLSNNAYVYTDSNRKFININSWFSHEHNTNEFMITFLDHAYKKYDAVTANVISFSAPPSYSYYYQTTVEINNGSVSNDHYQKLKDVVKDESSIFVVGAYYDDDIYDAWFIFYRIIDVMGIQNSHATKQLKLNPPGSGSYNPSIAATKLFNTNTYLIIYHLNYGKDIIYYYLLNATSQSFMYSAAKILQSVSTIDRGLIVRASHVSDLYLLVWEGDDDDIYGTVRRNDGSVFRSEFVVNIATSTRKQHLHDMISLNISDTNGFFAILYTDTSHKANETLHICILDDFGSHLKDYNDNTMDIVFFVNDKVGHDVQSASFTELDLGVDTTQQNKTYIVVTFAYELNDVGDAAIYIQLFEFTWSDGYTDYYLNATGNPFQITSSAANNPCAVFVSSVNNQILVAWINYGKYETNIKLLSTDIEIITASPVAAPTKHPSTTPFEFSVTSPISIVIGVCIIVICFGVIVCAVKKRRKTPSNKRITDDRAKYSQPPLPMTNVAESSSDDSINDAFDQIKVKNANDHLSQAMYKYMTAIQNNMIIEDIDIPELLDHYHVLLRIPDKQTSDGLCAANVSTCTVSNCAIFRRHYRARDASRIKNIYSPEYRAKLHILDKIHCFYQHPMNTFCEQTNIDALEIMSEFKTRLNNKYNQLHVANHNNKKVFVLGWEFKYIECKEDEKYDEDNTYCVHITQKYPSFKKELLENNILIQQFDVEYSKAQTHHNSTHRKNVYPNTELDHLLALLIYCNFDEFQSEFSKSYREKNGIKHQEFYHLGNLLKQAVVKHGTCIKNGRQTFYHGMNQKLVPTQIVGDLGKGISVFCPISASSCKEIANNFAQFADNDTDQGLIMAFGGRTSNAKYFSVAWLSNYSHEKEHLFLQNKEQFHIKDIIACKTGIPYREILNILKAMDSILSEVHYGEDDSSRHEFVDSIVEIMNHQLSLKHYFKKKALEWLDDYAQELLTVYFENKDRLTINCSVLQKKYEKLFKLICIDVKQRNYQWIRIDVLATIFPRLNIIEIKDINLCPEIMEDISKNRAVFGPKNKTWKLPTMILRVNKTSALKTVDAKRQYEEPFLNNQIKLYINLVDIGNKEYDTIEIK